MTPIARSPKTILRRLHRDDLARFLAYRTDPDVAKYQSWDAMDAARAARFIKACATAPLFSPDSWCQIGIADPANDLIGDMGLYLSKDGAHAELGITLARDHWGRGHGKDAMRLAIDLVWSDTQAQAIRCWGDQRNTGSVALMRSLGMTHLGTETTDVVEEAFILHRPQAG